MMRKKEDDIEIFYSAMIERWNSTTLTSRIVSKIMFYTIGFFATAYSLIKWHIYTKPRLLRCIRKMYNNE